MNGDNIYKLKFICNRVGTFVHPKLFVFILEKRPIRYPDVLLNAVQLWMLDLEKV